MTKIWTAVAERSGDTAFRTAGCFQKRRGSALRDSRRSPKSVVAAKGRVRFIRVHPWFNLKSPRTPAHDGERVEDKRIIGKKGNGMTNAGAQPAQTGACEL